MLKLFRKNKAFCKADKKTSGLVTDVNFAPKEIYLTLCEVAVSDGATVGVGEKLGCDCDKKAVYSGVSGKVSEIIKISDNNYRVRIENDFARTLSDTVIPFGKEHNIKVTDITSEMLISVIENSAVNTRGKQITESNRTVSQRISDSFGKAKQIVINCVGGEPYDTSVGRILLDNTEDILNGMKIVMAAMKIGEGAILVDSQNTQAANKISGMIGKTDNIKVVLSDPAYPADNEHTIIYTLTTIEISRTRNAERVKCIVFDAHEIASIARAFVYGERETGETVTVSGDAVENPMNVFVPYGTKISEIADYCSVKNEDGVRIFAGGIMRGREASRDDVFECGMSPIVALRAKSVPKFEGIRCIRCGECSSACPMLLMPMYLSLASTGGLKNIGKLFDISACVECGVCQYVCPAGIPLLENIKKAKSIEKSEDNAEKEVKTNTKDTSDGSDNK